MNREQILALAEKYRSPQGIIKMNARQFIEEVGTAISAAIESLLTENERLKDELAKYRDAHVVAWVNKRVPNYVEWNSAFTLPNSTPLIVKPDENK